MIKKPKCKRCGKRCAIIKDDEKYIKACAELGIPFAGAFRCLNCYPLKTGDTLNTSSLKNNSETGVLDGTEKRE